MKNDKDTRLHDALNLIRSEKNEVFINELKASIGEALARDKGEEQAQVVSAVNFYKEEKQKLENLLLKIFKRRMHVTYLTKPAVLGGFRIIVGDWKLDATLLHQLDMMKISLGGKE